MFHSTIVEFSCSGLWNRLLLVGCIIAYLLKCNQNTLFCLTKCYDGWATFWLTCSRLYVDQILCEKAIYYRSVRGYMWILLVCEVCLLFFCYFWILCAVDCMPVGQAAWDMQTTLSKIFNFSVFNLTHNHMSCHIQACETCKNVGRNKIHYLFFYIRPHFALVIVQPNHFCHIVVIFRPVK